MKRSNSRGLDELLNAGIKKQAREPVATKQQQQQPGGPKSSGTAGRGYGLASSSLQHTYSGATPSDSGPAPAACTQGLPEVCSPPPSKALNFAEVPISPFANAPALGADLPPWQLAGGSDRRQQPGADADKEGASGSSDDEGAEGGEDQENQHPCSGGGSGTGSGAATPVAAAGGSWMSPVASGRRAIASFHLPPAPTVSLLSPAMPTPAKHTPLPQAPVPTTLHHSPSFSSWMVTAARPPSPKEPPRPQPAACAVDVSDIVANMFTDDGVPRPFGKHGPTQLDFLLAQLEDSHYPASLLAWEQEDLPDSDVEQS